MPPQPSTPAAPCGLDVSLEDAELMAELALLSELIVALNRAGSRLSSDEVDTLLGL